MSVWLPVTLASMVLWGLAQGLVKKYIGEVPPARFCLYYAVANAAVNVGFWAWQGPPPAFASGSQAFALWGILAYVLDGIAWILYYQSIVYGPISIVGTLSAAYPALTVMLARVFLGEVLGARSLAGVVAVIAGCLLLAYSPPEARGKPTRKRWMLLAGGAVLIWGVNGTLIKYAYMQPGAHEANMALFIAIGGAATLGVYGLVAGRGLAHDRREWLHALGPMATMAVGSLCAAIAYKQGPASVVAPVSGAYPVVTLGFAWIVLRERPTAIQFVGIGLVLLGMALTSATG